MSFYICFDKDGQRNQIFFQDQIVPAKGSVLINHKYYLLHGIPAQIQWLKEKLPELSSSSDISLEELQNRIEPEIKNFSCLTTMITHTVSMSKLLEQDREKRFLNLMEKAGIPGMSVAAVSDDQLAWTEALGVANFDSKEKVTDHT